MIPSETIDDVKSRLHSHGEEVLKMLLPGGRRKGNKFIAGGIDGGPGESLDYILEGSGEGFWQDWATGEDGGIFHLWQAVRGVSFQEAVKQGADWLGMAIDTEQKPRRLDPATYTVEGPAAAFDWASCVADFTPEQATKLAEWRGYTPDFVSYLKKASLIGIYNGKIALPVHDAKGKVIACHYKDGKAWYYHPKGNTSPLVIGDPLSAGHTITGESQWDVFALLDKLGFHEDPTAYAGIATRGAANADLSAFEIPNLIAVPQNDPESKRGKNGKTPAEGWLEKLKASKHPKTNLQVASIPIEYADANDWIKDGAPSVEVIRQAVTSPKDPDMAGLITFKDAWEYDAKDDPDSLIGYKKRFVGRGASIIFTGPSGIGKSTLLANFAFHMACGEPFYGIEMRRKLKVGIVQAENDKGDIKEMLEGAMKAAMRFRSVDEKSSVYADLRDNLVFYHQTEKTGKAFCEWLEKFINFTGVDVVIADPLLSYFGDDISSQKAASQFFRDWINPILKRTGCILLFVHHTGKTSTDSKSKAHWNVSDYSYIGIGSSDITNWARAMFAFMPVPKHNGIFCLTITKRGGRAGMMSKGREPATSIFLQHGAPADGLAWDEVEDPSVEEPTEVPTDSRGYIIGIKSPFSWAQASAYVRKKGASVATAKRTMTELVRDRHIIKLPNGDYEVART